MLQTGRKHVEIGAKYREASLRHGQPLEIISRRISYTLLPLNPSILFLQFDLISLWMITITVEHSKQNESLKSKFQYSTLTTIIKIHLLAVVIRITKLSLLEVSSSPLSLFSTSQPFNNYCCKIKT